jgi:micrococcal nuclease
MRVRVAALLAVVLLLVAGCTGPATPEEGTPTPASGSAGTTTPTGDRTTTPGTAGVTTRATVVDVVDGDTVRVRLANGTRETVRLVGVDTPELYGSNTPDEFEGVPDTEAGAACLRQYGEEASAFARKRLDGQSVELAFDEGTGRRGFYGRLLAYVYVDGEQFNYALIDRGYARLYDSSFAERNRYAAAEERARNEGRGLWACAHEPSTGTATPGRSGLVVAAIHADAAGNDNENLNDEYVVFENAGDASLNLTGWTVEEGAGRTYAFPSRTTLAPGATLTLHTGAGTDTATDVYWGRSGAVWNNGGDVVIVRDADGQVVVRVEYDG